MNRISSSSLAQHRRRGADGAQGANAMTGGDQLDQQQDAADEDRITYQTREG